MKFRDPLVIKEKIESLPCDVQPVVRMAVATYAFHNCNFHGVDTEKCNCEFCKVVRVYLNNNERKE